jgi:hypothetical protein
MHSGLNQALAQAHIDDLRRPSRTAEGGIRRVWRMIARAR